MEVLVFIVVFFNLLFINYYQYIVEIKLFKFLYFF